LFNFDGIKKDIALNVNTETGMVELMEVEVLPPKFVIMGDGKWEIEGRIVPPE